MNIFINFMLVVFGIGAYFSFGFYTAYLGFLLIPKKEIAPMSLLVCILLWPIMFPALGILTITEKLGE